ncbi:uncharacterized protein LOC144827725 [Lissotriton helveticus]
MSGAVTFPGLQVGGKGRVSGALEESVVQGSQVQGPESKFLQELLDCSTDEEVCGPSPSPPQLRAVLKGKDPVGSVVFRESGQGFSRATGELSSASGVLCSEGPGTSVRPFSLPVRERSGAADLVGRHAGQSRQGEGRVEPCAARPVPSRDPVVATTSRFSATSVAPTREVTTGSVSRSSATLLASSRDYSAVHRSRSGTTSLVPQVLQGHNLVLPIDKGFVVGNSGGGYRRVQSASPPRSQLRVGKARGRSHTLEKVQKNVVLHASPQLEESLILDYDEDSPEEGELRDVASGGEHSHVSCSSLQAPVVQSQAELSRPQVLGPSVRAPRTADDVSHVAWRAEPSRPPLLRPGSVAGPRAEFLTIWIVGHSFIKRAQLQARLRYFGSMLGFNERLFNIVWKGKGGMLWKDLIPALDSWLVGGVCPDVLVLHLGENDLGLVKGVVLLRAMKKDLSLLHQHWSGCHVLWTELVPRRVWRNALKPKAIDKSRRKVNLEVSRFCSDLGFGRIVHSDICYDAVEFFKSDGVHLSGIGMDLYLLELREVLSRCLTIQSFLGE